MAQRLTAEHDAGPATTSTPGDEGAHGRTYPPVTLGPRQRTALISWAAFALTFGCARAVAHAVKNNAGSVGNAHWGDVHLHHYLWGIKLLALSGGVAIHGPDQFRANPLIAASYGAGAALIIDESALLLHLKDVYWTKRGRLSVVVGASLIAAVGASFALIPLWHRHTHTPIASAANDPAVSSAV